MTSGKACPGTTEEESKSNLEICNKVLEDPDIKTLYGVYKVEGAGRVTLDKTKGRRHISNIMCSLRKSSAYQKQVRENSTIQILINGMNVVSSNLRVWIQTSICSFTIS